MGPKIGDLIRPALVSLGVTGMLCSCSAPREFLELESPPPIPMAGPALTRGSIGPNVVFPPEIVSVVFAWESNETGRVDYYAYYGFSEDAITNLFGITANWAITNSIPWPDSADKLYGVVIAQNAYGRSDPSYVSRLPDWDPNAVKVDSVPKIDGQMFLWQSPNMRHWAGGWTRLPITNAITDTTFFMVTHPDGTNRVGRFPVTLTIEPLRLWNPEKKHYGG
jgi:hypothetical protein